MSTGFPPTGPILGGTATPQQCAAWADDIATARAAIAAATADLTPAQDVLDLAQAGVAVAQARVAVATQRYQADIDRISLNNGMIRQIESQMQMGGCPVIP